MSAPGHDDWTRLGEVIRDARKDAGFRDMVEWAALIKRSTRIAYGIERGEPAGEGTLENIEDALGWPRRWTAKVLSDATLRTPTVESVGPASEAPGFVAKSSDSSLIPTRTGNEQGLREEIARVRQEIDERFSRLEDDVRAIREAVVRDGGT